MWRHGGGCRQASSQVKYAVIISVLEEELSE